MTVTYDFNKRSRSERRLIKLFSILMSAISYSVFSLKFVLALKPNHVNCCNSEQILRCTLLVHLKTHKLINCWPFVLSFYDWIYAVFTLLLQSFDILYTQKTDLKLLRSEDAFSIVCLLYLNDEMAVGFTYFAFPMHSLCRKLQFFFIMKRQLLWLNFQKQKYFGSIYALLIDLYCIYLFLQINDFQIILEQNQKLKTAQNYFKRIYPLFILHYLMFQPSKNIFSFFFIKKEIPAQYILRSSIIGSKIYILTEIAVLPSIKGAKQFNFSVLDKILLNSKFFYDCKLQFEIYLQKSTAVLTKSFYLVEVAVCTEFFRCLIFFVSFSKLLYCILTSAKIKSKRKIYYFINDLGCFRLRNCLSSSIWQNSQLQPFQNIEKGTISINRSVKYQLYINFMRKNLIIFILVAILAWTSLSGGVGFAIVGPLTATAISCLSNYDLPGQYNSWLVVRIYQISSKTPGVDPAATQTLQNANGVAAPTTTANFFMVDSYMEICRGTNATVQVNAAIYGTPSNLYNKVYVKVEPNNVPGCKWTVHSFVDNCNYLKQAINAINQAIGYNAAGVYSTAADWRIFFGTSCNDIGTMDPQPYLWYGDYSSTGVLNGVESFADFVPFGGWDISQPNTPFLKKIRGSQNLTLCGKSTWHAFVDMTWIPFT